LLQENNADLPYYKKVPYEHYKINYNDELIFSMFSSDETIYPLINGGQNSSGSQTVISYRVYPDGKVDLPFVDEIAVAGLTLEEAARVVEDKYREIIPDASVQLALVNKTFTVIGEAGTGVFPVDRERLNILEALAMAGQIKDEGDFHRVKIIRQSVKGTEVLEFDIRPASIIESKYYYIYPNDIIYIQKSESSFYKIKNYTTFIGLISSSMSLLFAVMSILK
jgi:polysaccharide export outer membrane protein